MSVFSSERWPKLRAAISDGDFALRDHPSNFRKILQEITTPQVTISECRIF
ncbi:MAG: hypothetical protein ACXWIU_16240 [Limisphaerales bacterium]